MSHAEEILELWAERARTHKIRAALEITGEGLVIGAGALLAETKADARGRPSLRLDDAPRAMALLATGYEQPIGVHVVAKLRRACALWSEGEKALAHIHLAFAGLPPCGAAEGLRILAAETLIDKGVSPAELMKAQGFEQAALRRYNPEEPRNGRGRWARGGVDVAIAIEDNERDRIARERRARGEETPKDDVEHGRGIPLVPEGPLAPPPPSSGALETLQLPQVEANKLHHIFADPDHQLEGLLRDFGSEKDAFDAIAKATRDILQAKGTTGKYDEQVNVGQHVVTVRGIIRDGKLNIGTVFIPWDR